MNNGSGRKAGKAAIRLVDESGVYTSSRAEGLVTSLHYKTGAQ